MGVHREHRLYRIFTAIAVGVLTAGISVSLYFVSSIPGTITASEDVDFYSITDIAYAEPSNEVDEMTETSEEPVEQDSSETDIYVDVPELGYWDSGGDFHATYSYSPVAEPVVYEQSDDIPDLKTMGVVQDEGVRYTWYSERVLPGGGLYELNSNGRTVDENGYVVDGDGYISVASSDHPIGTVLDTPFGEAKVYDTGCDSGTIDIYTNW